MGQNAVILIRMAGRGIASATSYQTFDRTKRRLDPAWYDGTKTFLLQAEAKNTDSVDRQIHIVNSSGTVQTSLTIPAGTTAFTTFKTSSGWSPATGENTYRIAVDATTSANQLQFMAVFIRVILVNATKAWIPFDLVYDGQQGSITNILDAPVYSTVSTVYAVQEGMFCPQFKKIANAWQDTVDGWRLEVVSRGTNSPSNGNWFRLINETDAAAVADSEHNIYVAGINNSIKDFSHTATNFHDDDRFRMQWRSSSGLSSCRLFIATLWVKVSDLTKADIYSPILGTGVKHSVKGYYDHTTATYEPSLFTLNKVYFQTTVYREGGATGKVYLRKLNTAPDILTLAVPSDAQLWYRSADLKGTLVAGDRYQFGDEWNSGGTFEDIQTPDAVLVYEVGLPLKTLQAADALELADQPGYLEVVPIKKLASADALAFNDSATPKRYTFKGLTSSDGFSLADGTDRVKLAHKPLFASDALSFSDELSASRGRYYSDNMIFLAEIGLDAGELMLGETSVFHPTKVIYGAILGWPTIRRSIPAPSGWPHLGEASFTVADPSGEITALLARKTPLRRDVNLLMLTAGSSLKTAQLLFAGRIKGLSKNGDTAIDFKLYDKLIDVFEQDLPPLLTRDNFEMTEAVPEAFSPRLFGRIYSNPDATITDIGAVAAPQIDDRTFNAAAHLLAIAPAVYWKKPSDSGYTPATGYSIITENRTIANLAYTLTHIRFATPPPVGTLVRFDGEGMPKDNEAGQPVEENPAEIIRLYLRHIALRPYESIDYYDFLDTAQKLDARGYLGGGAFTYPITHGGALSQIVTSFNLDFFQNKKGLHSLALFTASDPNRPVFDDNLLILRQSVNQDWPLEHYNQARYHYNRRYTGSGGETWENTQVFTDEAEKDLFGITSEKELNLYFVRDPATAYAVAQDWLNYANLEANRISFDLPLPRTWHNLELAKSIGITHFGGITTTPALGYRNTEFKTLALAINPSLRKVTVEAIRRTFPIPGASRLAGYWQPNGIPGPHLGPANGIFYGIFTPAFSSNSLRLYRSLDYGNTWQEWTLGPLTNNLTYDTYQHRLDRTAIHVATQEYVTGRVAYSRWNTITEQWDIENQTVATPGTPAGAGVSVCTREPSGRPLISFQAQVAGKTAIRATWLEPSGWTSPITVFAPPGENAYYGRAIPGHLERVHFFGDTRPIGHTGNEYHSTLRQNDTVGPLGTWLKHNAPFYPAKRPIGWYGIDGDHSDPSGEVTLAIPFKGWYGDPYLSVFGSKDDLDSYEAGATILKYLVATATVFEAGATPSGHAGYPAMSSGWYYRQAGQEKELVTNSALFLGLLGSRREYLKHTAPALYKNQSFADTIVGPRFDFPTMQPQSSNARFLTIAGDEWVAHFFSTDYYGVCFEFFKRSDIPRPHTYTITQFLNQL